MARPATLAAPEPDEPFLTAAEIAAAAAECGLDGFPISERGVRRHAAAQGWDDLGAAHVHLRKRDGAGRPALEYRVSLLPQALQMFLAREKERVREADALVAEGERRRVAALKIHALPARPRAAMEARAAILTAIDGFAARRGESRAWAIGRYLAAQAAFHRCQEITRRRDGGAILTGEEAVLLARPSLLVASEGFHLDPDLIARANDRASGGASGQARVSRATLYGWFAARGRQSAIALAPEPPRASEGIPAGFADFLRHYARPQKPSATDAHAQYLAALPPGAVGLSLTQVRRVLREKLSVIERNVGREGLLTLRSRLAFVTRTTEGMWPTTVYTADGKTFDAEVADPVTHQPIRPEITTIMDVVTRRVVGTSYARAENQRTVAEALRRACVGHGIPAIFYVDRGPGYRNQMLDADIAGLMGRLGITKAHALPYGSQAKGRIERIQATIWDVLARRFPTYIGSSMDKEAEQKIHRLTRRELKAFGRSPHLPEWAEFIRQCEDEVAAYNDRPHRSLPKFVDPVTGKRRHMSPNEAWAAHVASGFAPVSVDRDEADDLFRPYEIRVTRRATISLYNNSYFHDALGRFHEQKVMVGYDFTQADRVWVREFDVATGQPGPLICVARFAGNARRYFPETVEQRADEGRANAALRRLDDKRARVEAERDGPRLVEAAAMEPAPFLDAAPAAPVPVAATDGVAPGPGPVRRRVFQSDEELAAWALAHPGEVSARQRDVLRACLVSSTARELFRMSGIDVEALRTLLRAVA